MDEIFVVRGSDGKVLGITYDICHYLDRDEFESWDEFRSMFAMLAFGRLPVDHISTHARRMLDKDKSRLDELNKPVVQQ